MDSNQDYNQNSVNKYYWTLGYRLPGRNQWITDKTWTLMIKKKKNWRTPTEPAKYPLVLRRYGILEIYIRKNVMPCVDGKHLKDCREIPKNHRNPCIIPTDQNLSKNGKTIPKIFWANLHHYHLKANNSPPTICRQQPKRTMQPNKLKIIKLKYGKASGADSNQCVI